MMRGLRIPVTLALLGAIAAAGSAAAQPPSTGTYVVVLDSDVTDVQPAAAALAHSHGGTVGFVYEHALRGFSIEVSTAGAAGIARSPRVAYVEADQVFTVAAQSMPTGIDRVYADDNTNIDIDGVDDVRVDVDVAVIDTGIDLDHPDLNVAGGTNCATFFATCGSGGNDGNGHGTHVAGTIGALDNDIGVVGVAPGARLWAVRVLGNNGTGTTSQIIAGIDWVTARASTIEVANMSLQGGASASIDSAAARMADAGVAVAVAAGNNDADAGNYSPARAAKVLTVSALADYDGQPGSLSSPPSSFCLDQDDTLADFSNWGAAVEIAAPGCRILSTYLNAGYAWINGTSMASPHVAGALALLASNHSTAGWTDVQALYSTLTATGNYDWTDESGDGIQEPLLDVHDTAVFAPRMVGDPGSPVPPNVSIIGSSAKSGSRWTATATVTVTIAGAPAQSSSVSWKWSNGASGSGTCTTGASGTCTVSKARISGSTSSVTFTVTAVDGSASFSGTSSIAIPRP
jgi:subtilisin family serine protease